MKYKKGDKTMSLEMTFYDLVNGKQEVLEDYEKAKTLWENIWNDHDNMDTDSFSKLLSLKQGEFEKACGGIQRGKEIMPWSGFAFLLEDEDNFDKTEKLAEAFKNSTCAVEVKVHAKKAYKLFTGQQ